MVIAMSVMLVVQMTINEVIDVVAMRNSFMAAVRTMNMVLGMAAAIMSLSTCRRVLCADFNYVLINMALVSVMKMTIVQVVDMVAMTNCCVAAISAVLVVVIFVSDTFFVHGVLSSLSFVAGSSAA